METLSHWPTHPLKSAVYLLALAVPLLDLGAQAAAGAPLAGTMSGPSATQAQAVQPSVEGVVISVEGSTIVLSEASGDTARVLVQPDALVLRREPATLSSIAPGEALGVAAIRGADGGLTATAVNIFAPELWQRARKGQFPMASGQVMTNAQVDRVVDKVDGRRIFLKYEMLSAAIDVPPSAQVLRTVLIQLSDLKAGMKVSLRLAPSTDGKLHAASVSAEPQKV